VLKGDNSQREEPVRDSARRLTNPSIRILVVDDDADIRSLSATVLRRFGYEAETAADGATAWETLQAGTFDLLITDHDMPRISGIELVKKLRSARMPLPVVLASGVMPRQELDRHAWLQPITTLNKPFSNVQLLATVNAILAQPNPAPVHLETPPV
jgi:DNA-binding response OmpR family regulator